MAYFPFFVDLSGRRGLIVGGGAVALRKVQKLLPYGPRLTVTAPEFRPEFRELEQTDLCQRPFDEADCIRFFKFNFGENFCIVFINNC